MRTITTLALMFGLLFGGTAQAQIAFQRPVIARSMVLAMPIATRYGSQPTSQKNRPRSRRLGPRTVSSAVT